MGVIIGGASGTALTIGKAGVLASRSPTGMTLRTPFRPLASPVVTCAGACLATAAATSYYIDFIHGPSDHGFERPCTLTSEWAQAEKVYRKENMIMGPFGDLGRLPLPKTPEDKYEHRTKAVLVSSWNTDGSHPAGTVMDH